MFTIHTVRQAFWNNRYRLLYFLLHHCAISFTLKQMKAHLLVMKKMVAQFAAIDGQSPPHEGAYFLAEHQVEQAKCLFKDLADDLAEAETFLENIPADGAFDGFKLDGLQRITRYRELALAFDHWRLGLTHPIIENRYRVVHR